MHLAITLPDKIEPLVVSGYFDVEDHRAFDRAVDDLENWTMAHTHDVELDVIAVVDRRIVDRKTWCYSSGRWASFKLKL